MSRDDAGPAGWRPAASLETLRARTGLMARIRAFFRERDVWEVDTPLLSRAGIPDPAIPSVHAETVDGRRWLHTSPEFPMKRLLAAGSGDIYQICPVFRDGERGRWHNPEFRMLEWYRLGLDDRALAREACELITAVCRAGQGPLAAIDEAPQWLSYRDAFRREAGIDPFADSDETIAEAAIAVLGTGGPTDWTRADWLDLLGGSRVFPALGHGRVTVLTDFPPEQAALARVKDSEPPVAARFELFLGGVELANGFHELSDAAEQRRRFEAENRARTAAGHAAMPLDEALLSAMAAGLPDCAGVALGLDRLLALTLGATSLADVMAFPWDRA